MTHRLARFVLQATVLLASSWVSMAGAQSGPSAVSDARSATLHIWRPAAGEGFPSVLVNGQPIGRLGGGGYLSHQTPAGDVVLEVSGAPRQAMTLAPGQASYWRLESRASGADAGSPPQPALQEVPANQARQEIRQISR